MLSEELLAETWSLPMASHTPETLSPEPPSAGITGLQWGAQLLTAAAWDAKSRPPGDTASTQLTEPSLCHHLSLSHGSWDSRGSGGIANA